ncbi:MAG: ABC transporter substrate-binding protein [Xanthobacteraceae bacterium]
MQFRTDAGLLPASHISRRDALAGAGALAIALAGPSRLLAADPFRIGWVRPTTGRLVSSFAPLYVSGQVAIKEINAAGGILGRQIVPVEEDDEGSPAKEPAVVKKLQDAGVTVICGPTGSSQVLASLASSTPAKIIQGGIANGVENSDGEKYPYHYQCGFTTVQEATRFVDYLVKTLGKTKIGILQENTGFGEQGGQATLELLKARGLAPASHQVYPIAAPDLKAYITNIKNAGADAVIFWVGTLPAAGMALRAMGELNWSPPIVGHSYLLADALFDLAPIESLRNVSAAYYRPFTYTDTEAPAERQRDFARKIQEYPETKRLEAIVPQATLYDFLHLVKMAAEAEKSLDPEAIKRRLDQTTGYKGLLGTFSFTPKNHAGLAIEDVVLAAVASGRDAKAQGSFRERAKGM